jgi:hypothetical protein
MAKLAFKGTPCISGFLETTAHRQRPGTTVPIWDARDERYCNRPINAKEASGMRIAGPPRRPARAPDAATISGNSTLPMD